MIRKTEKGTYDLSENQEAALLAAIDWVIDTHFQSALVSAESLEPKYKIGDCLYAKMEKRKADLITPDGFIVLKVKITDIRKHKGVFVYNYISQDERGDIIKSHCSEDRLSVEEPSVN